MAVSELMAIFTLGSQETSSDHSHFRLGSSLEPARMLTTSSRSGNSNRWGVSASRRRGPISGSSLIRLNVRSITSTNSSTDLKTLIEASRPGCASAAV